MWVVSKIIGDGLTPETAFRTAAQQYGIHILNAEHIPVDPKTGRPTSEFALLEIPDKEAQKLLAEAGCFVLPVDVGDKADISQKLIEQGCVVDIAHATKGGDVIAVLAQKVAVDFDSKTAVKK